MPPVTELNWLERTAVAFLRDRNGRIDERIRRLSERDLAEIRQLERSTIAIAALSGVISGVLIGGLEVWLNARMPDAYSSFAGVVNYWTPFLIGSILVSAIEIVFLYWLVLGRVGRISDIAGLRLTGSQIEAVVAVGLSRAALDVPDPREPLFGIDPYARVPRWRMILFAVAYRLKIGATSVLVRMILRRVLARAAVRTLIPLIAIVIYAVWNAVIIHWVMQAARIRVVGPFAIREFGVELSFRRESLNPAERQIVMAAVAEVIQVGGRTHPNLALLLETLFEVLALKPESTPRSWHPQRAALDDWSSEQCDILLRTVTLTVVLTGRPRRAQLAFLRQVHADCGRDFTSSAVFSDYWRFFNGVSIGPNLNESADVAADRPG
jgi:hypothetical protein